MPFAGFIMQICCTANISIALKSMIMNLQTMLDLSLYFLSVGVLMYVFLKLFSVLQKSGSGL